MTGVKLYVMTGNWKKGSHRIMCTLSIGGKRRGWSQWSCFFRAVSTVLVDVTKIKGDATALVRYRIAVKV